MPITPPTSSNNINRILRAARPEVRAVLRAAHDQKYLVRHTSGGHYAISTPPGTHPKQTVFSPSTPSDRKSVQRVKAKLRHIGVKLT